MSKPGWKLRVPTRPLSFQRPGHDAGGQQSRRSRRAGRHLRFDRQHFGIGGGLLRGRRHSLHRAAAAKRHRAGQTGAGLGAGATVLAVEGNLDDALPHRGRASQTHPIALLNSLNPFRLKARNRRLRDLRLSGHAPDFHALPVGNAGNITACGKATGIRGGGHHRNVAENAGLSGRGRGAAGAGSRRGQARNQQRPRFASAIGRAAKKVGARDESGGLIHSVSDAEILHAQNRRRRCRACSGEPACAPLAGLANLSRAGYFQRRATNWDASRSWFRSRNRSRPQDPNTAIKSAASRQLLHALRCRAARHRFLK